MTEERNIEELEKAIERDFGAGSYGALEYYSKDLERCAEMIR